MGVIGSHVDITSWARRHQAERGKVGVFRELDAVETGRDQLLYTNEHGQPIMESTGFISYVR
jgi:hypothetical protein